MGYVWVVGGGVGQLPLIQEFLVRDYEVVVGDQDISCAASNLHGVSVREADVYDDVSQLTACQAEATTRGCSPSGVMTAGIDATEAVSLIADFYHLPGAPWNIAYATRTKYFMRALCCFDHPWWTTSPTTNHPFPWVVKATNASASRGLSLCRSLDEMPAAVEKARAANHHSKAVIIEEYLHPHEEAATDWFVENDHVYYINGAYRWFESDTFGLETGWVNPFTPNGEIHAIVKTATMALGVTSGPFKADFIKDARYGWTLLEASTRWSGSFDHTHGGLYATGRNLSAVLVDFALGLPLNPEVLKYEHKGYVACCTPIVPLGTLLGETLKRTLRGEPHVIDVITTRDVATEQVTLADRPLFILAHGDTVTNAKANASNAWQAWLAYLRTTNLGGGT